MRRRIPLAAAAATAAALLALTGPEAARAEALVPLSDEELDDHRGGFLTAGGFRFDFGAVVRTTVDGVLVLETRLSWTPQGPLVETVAADGLAAADAAALDAAARRGLDLKSLPAPIYLIGEDAAAAHLFSGSGGIWNVLVNTGSDRVVLQETAVTLTLPGFEAVQRDMATDLFSLRLMNDVRAGLALGR